jgi:hypothetical protein
MKKTFWQCIKEAIKSIVNPSDFQIAEEMNELAGRILVLNAKIDGENDPYFANRLIKKRKRYQKRWLKLAKKLAAY